MSDLLGHLQPPFLLAVAWLFIVAEAGTLIGVFLPGTSVLVALGYFSHLGLLPFGASIAVAASAAVAGTHVSYLRGRARRDAVSLHRLSDRFGLEAWRRGRRMVERRGVWAVVAGQWFGSARTLVPRLSGWAGMPYRTFACASVPTASAWAATLVTLSRYLAPEVIRQVTGHLAVVGTSLVLIVLVVVYARHRHRGSQEGGPPPPAAGPFSASA